MTIWFYCAPLAILAVLFVLWRTRFPARIKPSSNGLELAFNRTLFQEKTRQLEAQLARGEIPPQEFEELQLEYKRQFLADNAGEGDIASGEGRGRWLVFSMALLVPVVAGILYLQLGASEQLRLRQLLENRATLLMESQGDSATVNAITADILESLAALSDRYPNDPLYPVLLARLHMDDGAYSQAIVQYKRVLTLLPEDADLRAEYAQVLFFAAGNKVTAEMTREAQTALGLAPDNQTALGLMGIASFNGGQFQRAIDYWSRAIRLLPPASPSRGAIEAGIAAARERLGQEPDGAADADAVAGGSGLKIDVGLAETISAPADATVFVYARAWQGSPMPLAIRRMTVGDLPAKVELDDTMAMNPAMSLSSAEEVEVVARISLSGQATPASGDYIGRFGPVKTKDKNDLLKLVITEKIP